MNAIEDNEFTKYFESVAAKIPKPKAILCVSAHWETRGTWITAMEKPRTIHDFGGFPPELYAVQYPAPGDPQLADHIQTVLAKAGINAGLDKQEWGLDHGTWSPLRKLYPKADIPVLQLSLDHFQTPQQHYEIGKALLPLREEGILIVGSGNIAHNLRLSAWDRFNETFGYDWTLEVQQKVNQALLNGDDDFLIRFKEHGRPFDLAIPTPEHYWPLLYVIALRKPEESITLFNDKPQAGSFLMTSVQVGH
jgi:4,5-DOPA dioxygenase extradiol